MLSACIFNKHWLYRWVASVNTLLHSFHPYLATHLKLCSDRLSISSALMESMGAKATMHCKAFTRAVVKWLPLLLVSQSKHSTFSTLRVNPYGRCTEYLKKACQAISESKSQEDSFVAHLDFPPASSPLSHTFHFGAVKIDQHLTSNSHLTTAILLPFPPLPTARGITVGTSA